MWCIFCFNILHLGLQVPVLDTRNPHMPGTLQGRFKQRTHDDIALENMHLFRRLVVSAFVYMSITGTGLLYIEQHHTIWCLRA